MGDIPGPSSSRYFNYGKAKENFAKLCKFITTVCSEVLCDVLSRYIKPTELRTKLNTERPRLNRVLNAKQKKELYPKLLSVGNFNIGAKLFDIPLLYTLLRNICGIQVCDLPAHKKKGWGKTPPPGDYCLCACIEIISEIRNKVKVQIDSEAEEMNDTTFHTHWNELKKAVVAIEREIVGGNEYERRIDELYTCYLNPTTRAKYIREFKNIKVTIPRQGGLKLRKRSFPDAALGSNVDTENRSSDAKQSKMPSQTPLSTRLQNRSFHDTAIGSNVDTENRSTDVKQSKIPSPRSVSTRLKNRSFHDTALVSNVDTENRSTDAKQSKIPFQKSMSTRLQNRSFHDTTLGSNVDTENRSTAARQSKISSQRSMSTRLQNRYEAKPMNDSNFMNIQINIFHTRWFHETALGSNVDTENAKQSKMPSHRSTSTRLQNRISRALLIGNLRREISTQRPTIDKRWHIPHGRSIHAGRKLRLRPTRDCEVPLADKLSFKQKSNITVTGVNFDFGPPSLDRLLYVRQKLFKELKKNDALLSQSEYLFQLCYHNSLTKENVCLELFDSLPTDIPNGEKQSIQRDVAEQEMSKGAGVMVWFIDDKMVKDAKKEMKALLSSLPSQKKFLVVKSGLNISETDKQELCRTNSVLIKCGRLSQIYDELYADMETRLDFLIGDQQRKNKDVFKKLKHILSSRHLECDIKLSKKCKALLASAMEHEIIGYKKDDGKLTLYVDEKKKNNKSVLKRIEQIKKCCEIEPRTCYVRHPLIQPHRSVAAGDCLLHDEISGTLGLFANLLRPGKPSLEMIQVGIASPHVIWRGCTGSVHIHNQPTKLGICIWPEGPTEKQKVLKANISDIAVIVLDKVDFEIKNFQYPVTLCDEMKSLKMRKVFKLGASSNRTQGTLSTPEICLYGAKLMVIEPEENQFSQEGDSGAVVLTQQGRQLKALGVIVGSQMNLRDSDESIPKNATIAVCLKEAIKRFNDNSEEGSIVVVEK